jgi:hypothetical protein
MGEEKANMMSSLPFFPSSDKPRLVGIARLATEGESLREGHNVEYFTLPSKSLLNRCQQSRNAFHLDYQSLPGLRIRMPVLLRPLHP